MRLLVLISFFSSMFLSASSHAETFMYGLSTSFNEDVNCFNDSDKTVTWKYCITTTRDSTSGDVMFEFHGLAGSENSWISHKRNIAIRQAWQDLHLQAPTVVSLSFGPVWLLAEKNSAVKSGLYEEFRDVIYPRINQKLGVLKGKRLIIGASMGGFNASQIYLKNPSLFSKYLLECPIMTDITPYSSSADIQSYIDRNHASKLRVDTMLTISKEYFPTDKDYATAWQLKLAPILLSPLSPPAHMSCGDQDPYGIYNSVSQFKDIAISKGVNIQWQSMSGGHCVVDAVAIAKFAAE